ncbi:helix-turn-helix domain-containing protein [Raoultella terrigena]|uniref:helix-turn-helix domain-containing protein n=1 Tax=Raoultella terrigena TaxID=577 RepID=UPI001074453E
MTVDNFDAEDDFEFPYISEREMCCERLIFNTTEDILLAMQDTGINHTELARKLGKSKAFVSQTLDGTRNMTLKTLADISYALGVDSKVVITKEGRDVSHHLVPDCTYDRYVSSYNNISSGNIQVIKITLTSNDTDYVENAFTGSETNRIFCSEHHF